MNFLVYSLGFEIPSSSKKGRKLKAELVIACGGHSIAPKIASANAANAKSS